MQRGKQLTAVELRVRLAVVKTTLPDQSRSAQLQSGVRRKAHAPFGAGERLRNPTYRHYSIVYPIGPKRKWEAVGSRGCYALLRRDAVRWREAKETLSE